jgi:LysM repeat protein
MNKSILALLGMAVIVGGGCETMSGQQQRQQQVRLHSDIANLKASIARIETRLDEIETGREDIYAQIARLQQSSARADSKNKADIAALESKLAAQAAAREELRKKMVTELSAKMEKILKSQAAAAVSVSGVQHIVKQGQTLSEIAKAYGVKTKDIIRVNAALRKNPDRLQVGQQLLIPE